MLNFKRVNRYCAQMIDTGLINYDSENRIFHITEKGKVFLQNSIELAQFISPINELLNKYRTLGGYGYSEELDADSIHATAAGG